MFEFATIANDTIKAAVTSHKGAISMLFGTLGYVGYSHTQRYRRMADVFATGRIMGAARDSTYKTTYFPRPQLERRLRDIIRPVFTHKYYLVTGEVGTGKSRILEELTRQEIEGNGKHYKGAPVYLLASQGASFPDMLATAVNFHYDEHVNLKVIISCMLQIETLPSREESSKLRRVLEAIENACVIYRDKHRKPAVLIIDSIDTLPVESVKKLQHKAKLWADSNICKLVLVSSDEKTEAILQEDTSCWSRAAEPIQVGDLTKQQAIELLCSGSQFENEAEVAKMDVEHAQKVFSFVGGRLYHLLACKRDFHSNVPFEETSRRLIIKERGKFVKIAENPDLWKAITHLKKSPKRTCLFTDLVRETSPDTVNTLLARDVIRCQHSRMGRLVKFQSPVTEKTLEEFSKTEKTVKDFYNGGCASFSARFRKTLQRVISGNEQSVTEDEIQNILDGN